MHILRKQFPHYCPFVKGIHCSSVVSHHKRPVMWHIVLSWMMTWINCYSNSRVVGDSRQYDVKSLQWIIRAARAVPVVRCHHYNGVIMNAMASQITSLTIVYPTVYSGADQRKHQSSASLAFVRGIHRWPVNSPHKGSVTRKMFPFDDVIMTLLSKLSISVPQAFFTATRAIIWLPQCR